MHRAGAAPNLGAMDDSSAPIFSESSAVRLPLQEHNVRLCFRACCFSLIQHKACDKRFHMHVQLPSVPYDQLHALEQDAFKSRTKTASKAQRVTVENSGEAAASPLYKILRSGKRILQTPARAARVAVEQPTTTIKKASRVPLTQVTGLARPTLWP